MLLGLVGRTILNILEEKNLPISEYVLFASSNSEGKVLHFMNDNYSVKKLCLENIDNDFNFALFSAGSDVSKKFAPIFAKNNCIVIDNSNAYRMQKDIPLIVPQVNSIDIFPNNGIIANPNCSTIQAVTVLKPLDEKYSIKRIIYSTYQAVSGAGKKAIDDLDNGIFNYYHSIKDYSLQKFPHPIFNNCLPHIDTFLDNGYSKEEEKMINETRKILHKPELKITATCVRVPVFNCHSECINIEFDKDFILEELIETLKNSAGIVVKDDILNNVYPICDDVNNKDDIYVGRIRRDFSINSGINIWIVADNLRRGAATNAVEILEKCLEKNCS